MKNNAAGNPISWLKDIHDIRMVLIILFVGATRIPQNL